DFAHSCAVHPGFFSGLFVRTFTLAEGPGWTLPPITQRATSRSPLALLLKRALLGGTRPFAGLRAPAGAAAGETLVAGAVAHHDRPAVRARRRVLLVEERRAGLRRSRIGRVGVARRENQRGDERSVRRREWNHVRGRGRIFALDHPRLL